MARIGSWVSTLVALSVIGCTSTPYPQSPAVAAADASRSAYVALGRCGSPAAARALSAPRAVMAERPQSTDEAVRLWTELADSARSMRCQADSRAAYRQIIATFSGSGHVAHERAEAALQAMGPE